MLKVLENNNSKSKMLQEKQVIINLAKNYIKKYGPKKVAKKIVRQYQVRW